MTEKQEDFPDKEQTKKEKQKKLETVVHARREKYKQLN